MINDRQENKKSKMHIENVLSKSDRGNNWHQGSCQLLPYHLIVLFFSPSSRQQQGSGYQLLLSPILAPAHPSIGHQVIISDTPNISLLEAASHHTQKAILSLSSSRRGEIPTLSYYIF